MTAAAQAGVTLTSLGKFAGDSVKFGGSEAALGDLAEIYRGGFAAAVA